MDNKGWGLPEMLILSSLIIFALIIAVVNIKKLQNTIDNYSSNTSIKEEVSTSKDDVEEESSNTEKHENTSYTNLENKMIKAAQKYVEQNFKVDNNITIIVDNSHLIDEDVSLTNDMSNNNCSGYVKVTNDSVNFYYTAYLKCDDYISNGYDNSYE